MASAGCVAALVAALAIKSKKVVKGAGSALSSFIAHGMSPLVRLVGVQRALGHMAIQPTCRAGIPLVMSGSATPESIDALAQTTQIVPVTQALLRAGNVSVATYAVKLLVMLASHSQRMAVTIGTQAADALLAALTLAKDDEAGLSLAGRVAWLLTSVSEHMQVPLLLSLICAAGRLPLRGCGGWCHFVHESNPPPSLSLSYRPMVRCLTPAS